MENAWTNKKLLINYNRLCQSPFKINFMVYAVIYLELWNYA